MIVFPLMAVRRREASLKRASSFERLLWGWKAYWPLHSPKREDKTATEQRRHNHAARPAKTGGSVELSPTKFAAGASLFGVIVFLAGAYPAALPSLLLCFAAVGLPWRIYEFGWADRVNRFFLLDFCYWVNLAVVAFFLAPPQHRDARVGGALYALADGPVAAALVVWQCPWVFPSADHTLSVLLHLLPGLAMAAWRHAPRPACAQLASSSNSIATGAEEAMHSPALALAPKEAGLWMLAAPLAFYGGWQLVYWLLVQVLFKGFIQHHNFDTSYKCLARRARRADNFWAWLVLRGSTARRLLWFGLIQLAFTAAALLAFVPTYYSARLAFSWQAAKFLIPVYHGARYQCERLIQVAVAEGIERHKARLVADSCGPLDVLGGCKGSRRRHAAARAS